MMYVFAAMHAVGVDVPSYKQFHDVFVYSCVCTWCGMSQATTEAASWCLCTQLCTQLVWMSPATTEAASWCLCTQLCTQLVWYVPSYN